MNHITLSNFKKNDFERVVHTGLYGETALEILYSIEGHLSDGYWENSAALEKYWKNEQVVLDDPISGDEPQEILIIIRSNRDYFETYNTYSARSNRSIKKKKYILNPFFNKDDNMIRNWFAEKIKKIVKAEEADNNGKGWWKNEPERVLDYLGDGMNITINECKKVYNGLKKIR